MKQFGFLLYPIMLVILVWMWTRVRGLKLEDLVEKSAVEHHQVNEIFVRYPKGGDWPQFQAWNNEQNH